jgi:hypothetical protein
MKSEISYIFNGIKGIEAQGKNESLSLSLDIFKKALNLTNQNMEVLKNVAPDLFEILGLRNLSSFVGEMFVSSLFKSADGLLAKNPHQDGYPDLLLMTKEGSELWNKLISNNQDKRPFSGFETGGIEIKATCGSVPSPDFFKKKNLRKPEIGDERINYVRGYDWKAHHRETNNLLGIYWDFINEKPIICGVFFCKELSELDWGKIVQPKEGGGRTTSVSIMTREGVYKMYSNWIAVIDDKRYMDFFNRFNKSQLIGPAA